MKRGRFEAPPGQCELGLKFRGGKRRGAGRKNRSGLRAHVARPRLSGREPVHVTVKVREGLPSLRRKDLYRALRSALRRARLKGLRVVHFNLLSNHVHLLVECAGNRELARGMQSLNTSLARQIQTALGGRQRAQALGPARASPFAGTAQCTPPAQGPFVGVITATCSRLPPKSATRFAMC